MPRMRSSRTATSTISATILALALVTALLLGSRVALGPRALRPSTAEASVTAVVVPRPMTDPEREAIRHNLELQNDEPNPMVTAIREAVGPGLSEDHLQELSRTVNLICQGTPDDAAITALENRGLTAATARVVLQNACR